MKTVPRSMNETTTRSTVEHQQQPQRNEHSLEKTLFRLKLQWIMAKDDNEKKRVSDEIRRLISSK